MKYAPPRSEHWFRLAFSLVGLGMTLAAIGLRGITDFASFEAIIIGGVFFGGSLLWSGWQLLRMPPE